MRKRKSECYVDDLQGKYTKISTVVNPLLADFKDLEKKGAVLLNIMDSSKGYGPSLEQSCLFIANFVREKLASIGATYQLKKVEIWEKGDNRSSLTF